MEQIAQNGFYYAHVAPLYWWFVGVFVLGISGLCWCLWQSALMAFSDECNDNEKVSLVRARETGRTR